MDFSKEEFKILNKRALLYKGFLSNALDCWDDLSQSKFPSMRELIKADKVTWEIHEEFIEICPERRIKEIEKISAFIDQIGKLPQYERAEKIKKYAEGSANKIARKIRDIERALKINRRKQQMNTDDYKSRNARNQQNFRERERKKIFKMTEWKEKTDSSIENSTETTLPSPTEPEK